MTCLRIHVLLWWLIGVIALGARAASPAVEAVLAADQARLQALMAGDASQLTRLFSDELVFVHSDGRIEGKAEYVRNLLAGDTAYANALTHDLRTQEPAPGVVVLIGAQEMRKRLGPDWSEVKLRFLAVWRREGDAWRMVSWQSMRPAGNSVVPKK
jgi:ketosteroid isomerase-like protein